MLPITLETDILKLHVVTYSYIFLTTGNYQKLSASKCNNLVYISSRLRQSYEVVKPLPFFIYVKPL